MARSGWVGASVTAVPPPGTAPGGAQQPEQWAMLQVFDDGWVEIPGLGRRAAHVRSDLRWWLGGLGALAMVVALFILIGSLDLLAPWDVIVYAAAVLLVLTLLVIAVTQGLSRSTRRYRDSVADATQVRQSTSVPPRRRPGQPVLVPATSAAELSSQLDGVHHVPVIDVVRVTVIAAEERYTAAVVLRDGSMRTYVSPDPTLHRLFQPFAPGSGASRSS